MKTNEIAKNFLETIIRSYGFSRKKMHALVDASFQEMLLSKNSEEIRDDCVTCPKDYMGQVLMCVDSNLQVVEDFRNAVAAVAFFKEDEADLCDREDFEGLDTSKKLVNVAFFEPIANNKTLVEQRDLKEQWQQKHYPMYHATLISRVFCNIADNCLLNVFTNCWTRSSEDDGYPTYRSYRVAAPYNKFSYEEPVPNVYVSLVMTEEDFLKINPEIDWENYMSW